MGLTSALFTGLSGLQTNQTRLNVVGNNIANVNTVAFKSSRAMFKPQFYVTDQAGSPAGGDFGGTNPSQRGLGAIVGSIEKDWSNGSLEPTGKATDLALDGDGFFVLEKTGTELYTRDGSFNLNQFNDLVSSDGGFVQGWVADENGDIVRGDPDNLRIPLGAASKAKETENLYIEGVLDTGGEVAEGASVLASGDFTTTAATLPAGGTPLIDLVPAGGGGPLFVDGDAVTLTPRKGGRDLPPMTLAVTPATTLDDLANFVDEASGTATTADFGVTSVAGEPAGARLAATGAATARLEILGNLGKANALDLGGNRFNVEGAGAGLMIDDSEIVVGTETFASDPSGESVRTSVPVYDSLGNSMLADVTLVWESTSAAGTTWRYFAESSGDTDGPFDPLAPDAGRVLATGTISFDTFGQPLGDTTSPVSVDLADTGSGDPLTFDLDLSGLSAVSAPNGSNLTGRGDGRTAGTLTDFAIGDNGVITGTYTNGLNQTLGQIAVATFDNPQGLIDEGGNLMRTGANSGDPQIGAPQTGLAGSIRSGTLELSNVDLSGEFIDMIISSTGFSAASRVISTSDQLLTELINSRR